MGPCKVSEFGARCACFAFPLLETWTVRDRLLHLLVGGSVRSHQLELFFTTASACWCTLVYLVPSRFVTPLEVCPRRHRTSEPTHWITISICNLLLKSSDEEMTSISQMETSQCRWRQFGPQTALPLGTRAYPSTICFCVTSVLASGSRWLQRWVRSFVPAVALSVSWLALGAKLHAFTCIDGHTEFHNDFLVSQSCDSRFASVKCKHHVRRRIPREALPVQDGRNRFSPSRCGTRHHAAETGTTSCPTSAKEFAFNFIAVLF